MFEWLRTRFETLLAPDDGASGGGDGGGDGGDDGDGSGGDGDSSSSKDTGSYPDFHKQYPEHQRGHAALKDGDKWLTPGDIAERAIEYTEKRDRLVEIPGEGATPEQIEAYRKKSGRHDSADDYNLAKREDWPNNVPWSVEGAKQFAERAYNQGMPKAMAEAMFIDAAKSVKKDFIGNAANRQARQVDWDGQLRESYKDKLDLALNTAGRAVQLIGDPTVGPALKEAHLDRHPGIVKMLNKAWNAIGEDKIFSGAVDAAGPGDSNKERIRSRYNATNFDESGSE